APDGGWLVLSATAWHQGLDSDFKAKLQEHLNAKEDIKQIAFGPAGSWVILRGLNGWRSHGVPSGMNERLHAINERRDEIKSVALAAEIGRAHVLTPVRL